MAGSLYEGGFVEVANACEYYAWAHGDGDVIVEALPVLLLGYTVSGAVTGDFALRDGTTAAGTLVHTCASGAAAGTTINLFGVKLDSGLFIDDNASAGTVSILYRRI